MRNRLTKIKKFNKLCYKQYCIICRSHRHIEGKDFNRTSENWTLVAERRSARYNRLKRGDTGMEWMEESVCTRRCSRTKICSFAGLCFWWHHFSEKINVPVKQTPRQSSCIRTETCTRQTRGYAPAAAVTILWTSQCPANGTNLHLRYFGAKNKKTHLSASAEVPFPDEGASRSPCMNREHVSRFTAWAAGSPVERLATRRVMLHLLLVLRGRAHHVLRFCLVSSEWLIPPFFKVSFSLLWVLMRVKMHFENKSGEPRLSRGNKI